MGNRPDWGAGLQTLGRELGQMANRRWLEEQDRRRRDQIEALRRETIARDDARWNKENPLMRVPDDIRQYIGLPEFQVGPMPGMDIPQYERTSVVRDWANIMPKVTKTKDPNEGKVLVTDKENRQYWMTPDKAYSVNNPKPEKKDQPSGYYVTTGEGDPTLYPNLSGLDGTTSPDGSWNGLPKVLWSPDASRGAGKSDKALMDLAAPFFGQLKQGGSYDKETQQATPYNYFEKGTLVDQNALPLDVWPQIQEGVIAAGRGGNPIDTQAEAEALWGGIMGGYDAGAANGLDAALTQAMAGFKSVPDSPGKWKRPEGVPMPLSGGKDFWGSGKLWPDTTVDYTKFYSDVISPALEDGTNEREWKTIKSWLKKNNITIEQLTLTDRARANLGQMGPAPAAGGASPAPVFDEQTGKYYTQKNGEWVEVQ